MVFGGRSGEHEVSLMSARSVMNALDRNKYDVIPMGITKHGEWVVAGDPLAELEREATEGRGRPAAWEPPSRTALEDALGVCQHLAGAVDVVFPVLHGPYGEDGTLQGLLEMANVPYVGSGVLGSALAMDKSLTKVVLRAKGLPVVDHDLVLRALWEEDAGGVVARLEDSIGYPCFVKPANLGSSVGVSKVHGRAELRDAVDLAGRYDRKVLVEKAVNAREIECSVLGNEHPEVSTLGEVVPQREFYDYVAKYHDHGTQLVIPADLPPETEAEIKGLAVRAFVALDCAGMARADFFVCKDTSRVYVNELNTIPGFTSVSMYPKLWEASGLSYARLADRLIELALERYRDRVRNRTSYDTLPQD